MFHKNLHDTTVREHALTATNMNMVIKQKLEWKGLHQNIF